MAAPSFYAFPAVAIDGSTATGEQLLNTSLIERVRVPLTSETDKFPTATTAVVYRGREGNSERKRILLSTAVYATVKTALTA